jgi:putative ferrous iron transport protein C
MILADLREYLRDKGRASLSDLVLHFGVDPHALRGMLGKWIHKGRVRLSTPGGTACGTTCCQCDPLLTEIYEWVDDAGP